MRGLAGDSDEVTLTWESVNTPDSDGTSSRVPEASGSGLRELEAIAKLVQKMSERKAKIRTVEKRESKWE